MKEYSLTIEAGKLKSRYFKDLWLYRELFLFLAWRDILVRYKQTAIGIAWAVIRPLLTMIIFVIIFGRVAGLPSEGVPYTLMVFSAMIPWMFFSNTIADGANSLINNERLISKVYFPRLVIPATSMAVSLVDTIIATAILPILLVYFRFIPSPWIFSIPLLTLPAIAAGLGIAFFLSALNVKYRDFRHAVPFMLQIGLYISPVGFSSSVIPSTWHWLYAINPMTGVIDAWRWAILGSHINWLSFAMSSSVAALMFTIGIIVFRNTEREFADFI